ncbi:MAG: 50S ribosomal protein L18 [Bacilli bacterium]|jgi:large subunit ribosomal protein L18|nr:50S ribosomal protein L18 [Bacilli bacterium]
MYTTFDRNAQRLHRHVRVRAKISGTASCPRISVFRSNKFIYAALINDEKHATLASSSSAKLGLDNPSNVAAATKVGEDLAKKALALGAKKVVFDRSGYLYHGQVKAVAEACRKAGLVF